MSIKNLWREPLVHFLLIGAALFLFYDLTREQSSETPNRIVVNSGQVEQLAANFKRTWMRSPTEAEMSALVESFVREEVFYREALAMGLDQNDPLVRKRMRMKLEFILEDLSSQNVTDEELIAFLEKHPDQFRSEVQLSFQQVFLNPNKRKEVTSDAKKILVSLNSGVAPDILGDSMLMPAEYSRATQSEIARSLGERFAKDVIKIQPGKWTGPINSEYGVHLLKVSERIEANQPQLEDVRSLVEREYLAQKRKEQKDQAYQQLREGYDITIEATKTESVKTAQAAADDMISNVLAGEAQ